MQTRLFALAFGMFYLAFGVAGLIPSLYSAPPVDAPHLDAAARYGYLFGQFPVNAVEDGFNIGLGVLAVMMSARVASARYFSMLMFPFLGLLTIMGFLPQADTVWGIAPISTSDTWVHAGTALLAAYFGYVALESTNVDPVPEAAH
jgi:hypothetical protein